MAQISTAWTFVRGDDSVRIARVALRDGVWALVIDGPGPLHRIAECRDLVASVREQAEEERRLIAQGYRLAQFSH